MRRRSALTTVLVAILAVSATAGPALAASTASPTNAAVSNAATPNAATPNAAALAPTNNSTIQAADTIYVTKTGDLVLAYRNNETDLSSGRTGVNVSANLVNLLVTDELNSSLSGDLQATLSRTRFDGNGSIVADAPDALQSLDFSASAVQNQRTSSYDLSLHSTVENDSAARDTGGAGSIHTSGRVRITPSRYSYTASASVDGGTAVSRAQSAAVTVTETNDGYRISVSRDYDVPSWSAARWNTKANATDALESQYGVLADSLNGTSDVTIGSYSFTPADNESAHLSIDYSVAYHGVKESVSHRITRSLARSRNLTLTQSQARDVSQRIQKLTVENLTVAMHTTRSHASVSATVELDNYDDLTRALLDVAAAQKDLDATTKSRIAKARKRLDAREAAGMTRTGTWSGAMEADGKTATIDFEAHSHASNWDRYVRELRLRDVDLATYTYDFTARTQGDRIHSALSVTVTDSQLVKRLTGSSLSSARTNSQGLDTIRSFQRAGFRRGKVDVSLADGTVTYRAAAKFENLSAFESSLAETYGGQVASIAGRTDGGSSTTYVRVTDAVPADPTRSDVRDTPMADGDTVIKMPGEWDRTFPAMDVESVNRFLGYHYRDVQTTTVGRQTVSGSGTNSGGGNNNPLPGFGAGVAVLALAAALLVTRRRRR